MNVLTMTPFGRQPVTAGLLADQMLAKEKPRVAQIGKWALFQDLCTARRAFAISDRDLTVLNALLSFLPCDALQDQDNLIVFPSNRSLATRAHGMAESTLRRHLAALVRAGLIQRHDSPNGKRYARKTRQGEITRAFGFDLRPLLVRAEDIVAAAEDARAQDSQRKSMREHCVLMCRDILKLIQFGTEHQPQAAHWDALDDRLRLSQRDLRRKLSLADLEDLEQQINALLAHVTDALNLNATEEMSGNDSENERHHQSSQKDSYELELPAKETKPDGKQQPPRMPLALILKACNEVQTYQTDTITTWDDLIRSASFMRGMMGITSDAWTEAIDAMGVVDAAISVCTILERSSHIKSPGGYLRALSRKARDGTFSTAPMIIALLERVAFIVIQDSQLCSDVLLSLPRADMGVTDGQATSDRVTRTCCCFCR